MIFRVIFSKAWQKKRLANSRYIIASERKQKDGNVISEKRKLVDKKTTLMKRKKEEEIKCINALNKDADNMYIKAEEKWNFDLLTKTNSFRK